MRIGLLAIVVLGLASSLFAAKVNASQGRPIAEFLDAEGRLQLANGDSASINANGYRMLIEPGQAPRFVLESMNAPKLTDSGQWSGFGGVRDGCNGQLFAMARMPNGNIVVAGSFTICTNTLANSIAIYSPGSNTWASLGSGSNNGVNDTVRALAISGNDLYVGGAFTQAGGAPASRIARWDGNNWSSLGSDSSNGVSDIVYALQVSGSDLYVGGAFTQAGGSAANRVARWNGSGWSTLGTGSSNGVNNLVRSFAVIAGDLYVGGSFNLAGGARPIA